MIEICFPKIDNPLTILHIFNFGKDKIIRRTEKGAYLCVLCDIENALEVCRTCIDENIVFNVSYKD